MLRPKPFHRLATSSDGADGTPPPSLTGLRWAFAFQTTHTGSDLIVETARREHNRLTYKLPQVERYPQQLRPEEAISGLLATPLFATLNVQSFHVLGQSAVERTVVPPGFKDETLLQIVYVHVRLETPTAYAGNDFMKPMKPQEILEHCQSYRYQAYRRVFGQFGLL